MKYLTRLSVLAACFALLTACAQSPAGLSTPAPTAVSTPSPTAAPEPSPSPTRSPEEAEQAMEQARQALDEMTTYSPVAYSDLARDPNAYYLKGMELSGTVFQAISDESGCVMLLAVDGDSDQLVWAGYNYDQIPVKVAEDDRITIQGVCMGTETYTTRLGVEKTVPAVLIRGGLTVEPPPTPEGLEYDHGPFELEERYTSGRLLRYTQIESFDITSIEESYSGDELIIYYTVIGTVSQSSSLSFDIQCYDADGFLIGSAGVYASVADGQRFRINDHSYIPAGTVRLEFSAD